jgi:hypothetical protein
MGSLVAKERIKFLLGRQSLVYPAGELSTLLPQPTSTVADALDEIYCLRNNIAHGDKVPDYYSQHTGRADFQGNLQKLETMLETISFLVRQSLLTILRDNLLPHFQDSASSEAFFGARGLTKRRLQVPGNVRFKCP